jgi:hypothetical protein
LVVSADDDARFELGAQVADRWMRLIKQPKGLFEKLEIGPQSRVAVADLTDSVFLTALRERAANVAEGRVPEGASIIIFGAETRESLRSKIHVLRARMIDSGALWIVRPKGAKAIAETDVMEAIREAGLVDTKVVAFSRTHTAHKCVIPVELRGQVRRRPPILTIPPSAPVLGGRPGGAASSKAKKPSKSVARARLRPTTSKRTRSKPKKRR